MKKVKSYCRNCMAACGLELEVEHNRIVKVRGDSEHPTSQGYLCIKGRASIDHQNGEDRLRCTTQRSADGSCQSMELDKVYDQIAEKLSALIERYGPRSIGLYYGTGTNQNPINHALVKSWLNTTIGSPNLFSSITIDQSAKWVTAGRLGYFATGKHTGKSCEVALLVGTNPVVSHMGAPACPFPAKRNPLSHIREYRKEGVTKLIVIDPRLTETAQNADLHLQIKPGEDAVVFAAMIHEIFRNGWEDRHFLDRFAVSVDRLKDMVSGITPAIAANRAGIEPGLIEQATKMFAKARSASAFSGTGPNMSPYSNLAEHLIETLNVVCGGYRRTGDKITNTGMLFGAAATEEKVIPPTRAWEKTAQCLSGNTGKINGEFPTALLPGEITSDSKERIRALIVVGGNPVGALGQPGSTLEAFKNLEVLVSLDIRETETTAISDYVIATKAPYERYDFTGLGDMHSLQPFAQYTQPIVEPSSGLIDDWEFFWEISRRMKRQLVLKRPAIGLPDELQPDGIKLDMVNKPSTIEIIAKLCELGGRVHFDDLKKHSSGLYDDKFEPVTIKAAVQDDGCRMDVCPEDICTEFRNYFYEKTEPDYQYLLVCRRRIETMNSAYVNAQKTRTRFPQQPVHMHPADIKREDLTIGELVEIRSEVGNIVAQLHGDDSLKRGVISTFHMANITQSQTAAERGVNHLVSLEEVLEPINFMPRQSSIPVNVYRIL
ncbi:MAG: molybdopterin-dependent oxidoreductase [Gammaproteobacteria bacterium]|nr:molybdopterin-dependent oxidoreductase [Gammaproteobacteria bacterium]